MKRAFLLLVLIAVYSGLLTACPAEEPKPETTHQHQSVGHQDGSTENRWQVTHNNGFKVTYVPQPDPVPLNQHFQLHLTVTAPDDKPLSDVSLEMEADMPEHKHGMNVKPEIQALGAGKFIVKGLLFHMPGHWHIYAMVRKNGQPSRERAIFSLSPR